MTQILYIVPVKYFDTNFFAKNLRVWVSESFMITFEKMKSSLRKIFIIKINDNMKNGTMRQQSEAKAIIRSYIEHGTFDGSDVNKFIPSDLRIPKTKTFTWQDHLRAQISGQRLLFSTFKFISIFFQ